MMYEWNLCLFLSHFEFTVGYYWTKAIDFQVEWTKKHPVILCNLLWNVRTIQFNNFETTWNKAGFANHHSQFFNQQSLSPVVKMVALWWLDRILEFLFTFSKFISRPSQCANWRPTGQNLRPIYDLIRITKIMFTFFRVHRAPRPTVQASCGWVHKKCSFTLTRPRLCVTFNGINLGWSQFDIRDLTVMSWNKVKISVHL